MIKIHGGYYLKIDPRNFILCEEIKQNDTSKIIELTYHKELSSLYKSLVNRKVKKKDVKNIEELSQRIEDIYTIISNLPDITLEDLIKELKGEK